ncbi:MAG TPA: FUSC family protein [Xanthobacteraceae bacterium]|nr:FUSC family protein [Xanthobacteraceae bacterium]
MAETQPAPPQPSAAASLSRWHGDGLLGRSIRFTLLLMAPLFAALLFGGGLWIAYALLTCILSFLLDTGGSAPHRLGAIAVAGAVVLAGTGLGTLASGNTALIALALAFTGMIYALVESSHPSAAFAARFMCLTTAVGALYVPLQIEDVIAVTVSVAYAWLVSVGWDAVTGIWRPSTTPRLDDLLAHLRATERERWVFAIVVAATVSAAFLTSWALGFEHSNWALLAIVAVMRSDAQLSRRMILNLMLGTLIGVGIALAYGVVFTSPLALMIGMAIAAMVRWPAQQVHTALGLAAMAAFIILLMQLAAIETSGTSHAPFERVVDIALGCGFAVVALGLNGAAQMMLRHAKS